MEVDEVHNGDPLIRTVRVSQMATIVGCIANIGDLSDKEVADSFKNALNNMNAMYDRDKRINDGDDIINKIFKK